MGISTFPIIPPSRNWTLIQSVTANNTSLTITFSSIPAYPAYMLYFNRLAMTGGNGQQLTFNGDTSNINYASFSQSGSYYNANTQQMSYSSRQSVGYIQMAVLPTYTPLVGSIVIDGADFVKKININTNASDAAVSGTMSAFWASTAQISSMTLTNVGAGNFWVSGTVSLYGSLTSNA